MAELEGDELLPPGSSYAARLVRKTQLERGYTDEEAAKLLEVLMRTGDMQRALFEAGLV